MVSQLNEARGLRLVTVTIAGHDIRQALRANIRNPHTNTSSLLTYVCFSNDIQIILKQDSAVGTNLSTGKNTLMLIQLIRILD